MKLEGPVCDKFISEVQSPNFKEEISKIINNIQPHSIRPEDIVSATIAGKVKKHIKIKTSSATKKTEIIKLFKKNKPIDIYAQEYLTKHRAELLFKLRGLRKSNPTKITSVYTYNGNICTRLSIDIDKIHNVNSSASFNTILKVVNDE